MGTSILFERFKSALTSSVDGEKRLAQELANEDEYFHLAADLLRQQGAPDEVLADYARPVSVSGGSDAAVQLLAKLSADLADAAARAHIQLPPYLAVWWPDRAPSARSALGSGGALIRINLGLLAQLRSVMHLTCSSLEAITGDVERWGHDKLNAKDAGDEFRNLLDEYCGGQRISVRSSVRVHFGKRERFRRLASVAGLAYVLAHELGHLVTSSAAYNQAALIAEGPRVPGREFTEVQAVASFNVEMRADLTAIRILQQWNPFDGADWQLAKLVGPAAVMAIQATRFWFEAAITDKPLDWTHPDPDLRIEGICVGMSNPEELERVLQREPDAAAVNYTESSEQSKRFVAWLNAFTGHEVFRAHALKRGLADRGLTPIQLAALYMVHGVPGGTTNDTQV
jgi:hypothetical protein